VPYVQQDARKREAFNRSLQAGAAANDAQKPNTPSSAALG
jgi:hypothetical protein